MENRKLRAIELDSRYHADYFTRYRLGDADSWMREPEEFVLTHLQSISGNAVALDLGCGPGRLSMPILDRLHGESGCLVCIDRLDEAISTLVANISRHPSAHRATIFQADIANITLVPNSFDAIVAWSVWEATFTPAEIEAHLRTVEAATRSNGVALIMFNTAIECRDTNTQVTVEHFKLGNMPTPDGVSLISRVFGDWLDVDIRLVDDSETTIDGDTTIQWSSVHLMFFGRKR